MKINISNLRLNNLRSNNYVTDFYTFRLKENHRFEFTKYNHQEFICLRIM